MLLKISVISEVPPLDGALDPQRDVRTSLEKTISANPTQRVDYGYDSVDQLTGEVLSQGGTPQWNKSFAYDAMGNRTTTGSVTLSDTVSSTYTVNKLNQITAHSSSWSGGANTLASALQYDQGGNLTKWTSTGTGSATSAHTEYTYDDLDRLTSVIKKNPTSSANESKTEFQYDGYSRLRVSKEYTWNGTAWVLTANSEKHRIYDGMDVVQERDENNAVLATYTRDGNIGGILSKRDDNGDDYFFHYDGSGNVIGLTDENEDSVAEYAYDAYGDQLSSSGVQASNNSYRYSTKEYFGSIGLYNYGYRFYSPGLGRWINRDPIEEEGGLNLYGMVGNNPVNSGDEYGLAPVYSAAGSASGWVGGTKVSINGGTLAERKGVAWMVAQIMKTNHATSNEWGNTNVDIYLSHRGGMGSSMGGQQPTYCGLSYNNVIHLDLDDAGLLLYNRVNGKDVLLPTPLIILLAHEFGHAIPGTSDSQRYKDKTKVGGPLMGNVDLNENPIRQELGFAPRSRYQYPIGVKRLSNGKYVYQTPKN